MRVSLSLDLCEVITYVSDMTSRIANRLGALALAVADAIERAAGNLPGGVNAGAALVAICNHPNENIRVLQGALGLTHSGVVRLLDGLEGAGFVERRRGVAEDGRAAAVIPTKKGRRRAQDILRARAAALDDSIAELPLGHKMAFEAAVDAMLAALTRMPADARRVCRLCEEDVCRPSGCPVEIKAKGFN